MDGRRSPLQQVGAWVDRAADPNRRLLRWIGLVTALVAAVGLTFGLAKNVLGDDDSEAGRQALDRWVSDDESTPELMPADGETGFLGLRLGAPIATVEDLLGRPTEVIVDQTSSGGGTIQFWDTPGLRFSFHVNEVGAVADMSVAWAVGSIERVGLPRELVLGRATVAEVFETYGLPQIAGWTAAENAALYAFEWRDGPEGSEYVEFGLVIEGGAGVAPVEEVDSLCDHVVTSYELSSEPVANVQPLETPICGVPPETGGRRQG